MKTAQIDLQTACRMGQIETIKQAYLDNKEKINEKDPSVRFR